MIDKYNLFSKEFYPDPNDLKSVDVMLDFLPDSLKLFLDELLVGKSKGLKMATIGQCLVQVARPRALVAPLQLGLAVQLHHKFGSKFLVNTLQDHGLCLLYAEVLNFESWAVAQTPITADIDTDSDSPVQVMDLRW
ncbi:hypothetical protein SNE40_014336 [Patella caerulea]|uniref:Uncharacterized protein n=1 Tax=Patella caerulea TaxID=87958 RepID=A0AAN8PH39_PATCE